MPVLPASVAPAARPTPSCAGWRRRAVPCARPRKTRPRAGSPRSATATRTAAATTCSNSATAGSAPAPACSAAAPVAQPARLSHRRSRYRHAPAPHAAGGPSAWRCRPSPGSSQPGHHSSLSSSTSGTALQGRGTPALHIEMADWLGTQLDRTATSACCSWCSATPASRRWSASTAPGCWPATPDLRILVLSAESTLATKMTRNVRRIIERHPMTKHLMPDRREQWASDQLTVQRRLHASRPVAAGPRHRRQHHRQPGRHRDLRRCRGAEHGRHARTSGSSCASACARPASCWCRAAPSSMSARRTATTRSTPTRPGPRSARPRPFSAASRASSCRSWTRRVAAAGPSASRPRRSRPCAPRAARRASAAR